MCEKEKDFQEAPSKKQIETGFNPKDYGFNTYEDFLASIQQTIDEDIRNRDKSYEENRIIDDEKDPDEEKKSNN